MYGRLFGYCGLELLIGLCLLNYSHSNITFVLTVNSGLNGAFSCCFSMKILPIPLIQQEKCCQKVLSAHIYNFHIDFK